MGLIQTDDKVNLYFESTGSGIPIVFIHEYAGDYRSWEPQVRYFSRRYQCVTFNARGYPPSEVPNTVDFYSQDRAWKDILAVLDNLEIDKAHIVGLSMGGFATLHFGLQKPERCYSLVVAGCGYGAETKSRTKFKDEAETTADEIERQTMGTYGKIYGLGPTRVQFQNKDPRGSEEFIKQLCEHSTEGSANTMRGVQAKRPSLYDFTDQLRELTIPTLIINGDEDDPCLNVGVHLKQTMSSSALVILPRTGHASNLEEPSLFNMFCENFFHEVDTKSWKQRDERSLSGTIISNK